MSCTFKTDDILMPYHTVNIFKTRKNLKDGSIVKMLKEETRRPELGTPHPCWAWPHTSVTPVQNDGDRWPPGP